MIPTKPISPLTATAAAVPIVAQTTTARRTRPTWTPSVGRLLVADAQHVEQPPVEQDPGQRDGDVRQENLDVVQPDRGSRPRIHE